MANAMRLEVWFEEESMAVTAQITFQPLFHGRLSFLLAETLKVVELTADGSSLSFSYEEVETPQFRCPAHRIVTDVCTGVSRMTVTYRGMVSAWHNILRKDLHAVNIYSGWYPYESPDLPDDGEIEVHAGERTLLLKGEYHPDRQTWSYQPGYDPFNLILFDREAWQITAGDCVRVYWSRAEEQKTVERIIGIYEDIHSYYNRELYVTQPEPKNRGPFELVSLGLGEGNGAYFRRELIVMGEFPAESEKLTRILGHELGHTWGSGADYTWEDWLNETVAEWSCLCYLWERKGEESFLQELRRNCRDCKQYPPIRTPDGSRPEGVHEMGTALFEWIWQKAGIETVKQMLRLFAGMEKPRATDNYLAVLESGISPKVAGWVRDGLESTAFLNELSFLDE